MDVPNTWAGQMREAEMLDNDELEAAADKFREIVQAFVDGENITVNNGLVD